MGGKRGGLGRRVSGTGGGKGGSQQKTKEISGASGGREGRGAGPLNFGRKSLRRGWGKGQTIRYTNGETKKRSSRRVRQKDSQGGNA